MHRQLAGGARTHSQGAPVEEQGEETLHVGPGTFLPVRGESIEAHRMHPERYEVSPEAAAEIDACRARGGRVVAVGTTSVRPLESAFDAARVAPGAGRTALFVRPLLAVGREPECIGCRPAQSPPGRPP